MVTYISLSRMLRLIAYGFEFTLVRQFHRPNIKLQARAENPSFTEALKIYPTKQTLSQFKRDSSFIAQKIVDAVMQTNTCCLWRIVGH